MLNQAQIAQAWGPACSGIKATVALHGTGKVTVRAALLESTKALNQCLIVWNYRTIYAQTGGFVCRKKVSGNGWSNHSYATAIDLNWLLNPYGGTKHHIPSALAAAICKIRTNNGKQVWNWGGYWSGAKDWMHFEVVSRPSDIATGINWKTVPGSMGFNKPAVPKPSNPTVPAPSKKKKEEDMTAFIRLNQAGHKNNGRIEEVGSFDRRHITKADELALIQFLLAIDGRSIQNVSAKDFDLMTRNKRVVNTGQ